MSKALWISLGAMATGGAAVAGLAYYHRTQSGVSPEGGVTLPGDPPPSSPPPKNSGVAPPNPPVVPTPPPNPGKQIAWEGAAPLPTAAEVKGDLVRNWGKTPTDLRPLFTLAEEASGIVGAARVLAVIASRESSYVSNAHNGDETEEKSEVDASYKAYHNNKDKNPPLKHGEAAANFGSGGLYAALAPYFLWTGVQEMKGNAPLLNADPRIMFLPRVATFAACVYLQRLLANYDIRDVGDIKVGWGSISLLSEQNRGGDTYQNIRTRFYADAAELGISFQDAATIPAKLSAAQWPGVAKVFAALVGKLPTSVAVA